MNYILFSFKPTQRLKLYFSLPYGYTEVDRFSLMHFPVFFFRLGERNRELEQAKTEHDAEKQKLQGQVKVAEERWQELRRMLVAMKTSYNDTTMNNGTMEGLEAITKVTSLVGEGGSFCPFSCFEHTHGLRNILETK